jgi:hypothetical protein
VLNNTVILHKNAAEKILLLEGSGEKLNFKLNAFPHKKYVKICTYMDAPESDISYFSESVPGREGRGFSVQRRHFQPVRFAPAAGPRRGASL